MVCPILEHSWKNTQDHKCLEERVKVKKLSCPNIVFFFMQMYWLDSGHFASVYFTVQQQINPPSN